MMEDADLALALEMHRELNGMRRRAPRAPKPYSPGMPPLLKRKEAPTSISDSESEDDDAKEPEKRERSDSQNQSDAGLVLKRQRPKKEGGAGIYSEAKLPGALLVFCFLNAI